MEESYTDEEIRKIQACMINGDFNQAAFYILDKKMLHAFEADEKQQHIETLAKLLEETSPYWPDLEEDIIRIIAEKFLE